MNKNTTELCKWVQRAQDEGSQIQVNCEIMGQKPIYSKEIKKCKLCDNGKIGIISIPTNLRINKKREVFRRCGHKLSAMIDLILWESSAWKTKAKHFRTRFMMRRRRSN